MIMSTFVDGDPGEYLVRLHSLQTPQDVASLLEVDYARLIYHVYKAPAEKKYRTFAIPKKSGALRTIMAPISPLKLIQRKLGQALQAVYQPGDSAHGFVIGRSILTNARVHAAARTCYVLNIDLADFFPSIHFGRVRGLFMAHPFALNAAVATLLAQICCHENQLPQGAPTSPVISNLICWGMDRRLAELAGQCECRYTRYADDLTFSTARPDFPCELAALDENGVALPGEALRQAITESGFAIQAKKVTLRDRRQRMQVTGLTINVRPNVRRSMLSQVRAMLHAWDAYGLAAAEAAYWERYARKPRRPGGRLPAFRNVVRGKIAYVGMVRGKTDALYLRLKGQFDALDLRQV